MIGPRRASCTACGAAGVRVKRDGNLATHRTPNGDWH
jgi:hypothetical protein